MTLESVLIVAAAFGVLTFAYFLDAHHAKLLSQARPSSFNRKGK
jgi:hypothetical protein